MQLVNTKETPYGKLSLIKQGKYYSFYNNGLFIFSTGDTISPEVDVSLAIAESESINNILIINNGIDGLIENLILYPSIKNITYIEDNKFLLNLYLKYISADYLNDKRLDLILEEPRNILKKINKKYNIIFLNNGDPFNLQINRFYTYEFFKMLKSILSSDGIIFFKLSSSENFINKYQSLYIGSIYNTIKGLFKDVMIIPGDNCYFLASNKKGVLTHNQDILNSRIKKFSIKSEFFNNYFLKSNLTSFKINSFLYEINMKAKPNHDLNPISFFYNLVLWSTRTSSFVKNLFSFFYKINFFKLLIFIFFIFIILNIKFFKSRQSLILLSMGTVGFTEIFLEIIAILLYQTIRGSLYINMGLIFFSFMIGLTLGSYFYNRIKLPANKIFVFIQFLFIFFPVLLILYYFMIRTIQITLIQDILFFIFILQFSMLSGLQFPAAVNLYPDKIFGPGKINGADLFSSALGAFIISLFIIPLYGIFNCILLLIVINFFTFIKVCSLLK